MTDIPAPADAASRQSIQPEPQLERQPHPSDALLNLIVILLAPMFLAVSGGDLTYARMAALETVNSYRAETRTDLLTIAQIVAFGLAALGSLSLSMADDLSLSMTLRLRANANACSRSVEHGRRALQAARQHAQSQPRSEQPQQPAAQAEGEPVPTSLAAAPAAPASSAPAPEFPTAPSPRIAPAPAATPAAGPTPRPAATPATPTITDEQRQAMWAAGAARIAAEYTADLANLPPEQRSAAAFKAEMLNSCAQNLLTGPPIPRVRPGDLAAFLRTDPS